MSSKHVPEIDALRAFAVLAVIGFHAWPSAVPGGYVGVDVFFVVSGYVISRANLAEMLAGRRSYLEFFLARVRRLLPAQLLVLAATTVAATAVAQPSRLMNFARSLAAQPLYLQNVVFWAEGDYFDRALAKPLLHTWSLAVEEQFYLAWAVLVVVARRSRRSFPAAVALLVAASYVSGAFIEPRSPKTAFYLLPTRVWEIGLGVLVSLLTERMRGGAAGLPAGVWSGAPVAGVAILAWCATWPPGSPFPGPHTLLACGATGALVALLDLGSGHRAFAWLRFAPLRYVGEISYSLYLWHWPPLALWFLRHGTAPSGGVPALLMAAAAAAAVASHHLVENPIRRRLVFRERGNLVRATLAGCASVGAVAAGLWASDGLVGRYDAALRPYFLASQARGSQRCGPVWSALHPGTQICPLGDAPLDSGRRVLLLGDSHMDVTKEAASRALASVGVSTLLTARNCEPGSYKESGFCGRAILAKTVAEAVSAEVSEILVVSYWAEGPFSADALDADLTPWLEAGISVTLASRVPWHQDYDPAARADEALAGRPLKRTGVSEATRAAQEATVDAVLDEIVRRHPASVRLLHPDDILCPSDPCDYEEEGVPLYLDYNHLSLTGARRLEPLFAATFRTPFVARRPPVLPPR